MYTYAYGAWEDKNQRSPFRLVHKRFGTAFQIQLPAKTMILNDKSRFSYILPHTTIKGQKRSIKRLRTAKMKISCKKLYCAYALW